MKTNSISAGLALHAQTIATARHLLFRRVCLWISLLAFAMAADRASADAQTYVNFEGKQTRPICLSPDGTRLFEVNTPDARLSGFDVTHPFSPFLIAEIPVGGASACQSTRGTATKSGSSTKSPTA